MKKLMLVALFAVLAASLAIAQGNGNMYSPTGDVLGAHQNQGRGCAGCHQPHSGARGSGQLTTDANSGDVALWGQDVAVLYGQTFTFGDAPTKYSYGFPEKLPGSLSAGISDAETGGLLMCLSCHDGSLTQTNMMANQSYEQKIGVLPSVYGTAQAIPTLLGNEGSGGKTGDYYNDHPVGIQAQISNDTNNGCTAGVNCTGLVFTPDGKGSGALTVTAGSQYAQFVANYGWPALAPGMWSNPYGVGTDHTGALGAFVVCTTCHDQHVMNVYTSTPGNLVNTKTYPARTYGSPIAGDGGGHYYRTFFFIRGPYNVTANTAFSGGGQASSTTQFCRQCHFSESNEANNGFSITTLF